ncbi:hypothetical protein V5O48_009794 [Marasmius crinis-equi]|uniref:Uncharacterized protein n=1 Tax=Marasmius crinis-equi TaxID=585013 RepID=A0ABR3FA54_9AGAR
MKYQQKKKGAVDQEILEDMEDSVQRSYKKSLRTLSQLFQFLDGCEPQPSHDIFHLYTMSSDIEAAISNVIARMDQTEAQRLELERLRNDKAAHDQSRKINAKFREIIRTPTYEQEGTGDQHSTLCIASGCYSNCDPHCSVRFTLDSKSLGNKCSVFKDPGIPHAGEGVTARCRICSHLAEDHQHHRSKWVKKMKTGTVIDEDAERRFKQANSEAEKTSILMEGVQNTIRELEREIADLENELSELCDRYNDLAISGSFTGYISSAIRLLKTREQTMKKEGAAPDALDRMADRIWSLENKRNIVEEAEKAKRSKSGFREVRMIAPLLGQRESDN